MVGVTRINVYTAHSPCCADEAESRERAVQQRFKLSNFPTFQLSNFPTFQLSNFPTFQLSNFPTTSDIRSGGYNACKPGGADLGSLKPWQHRRAQPGRLKEALEDICELNHAPLRPDGAAPRRAWKNP
jgi:hypothetical protein